MIVVIQCAARKRTDAGLLRTRTGAPVMFVADPRSAPPSREYIYARPDDPSDTGATWRDVLLDYNRTPGSNPLGLHRAFELYENKTYGRLAKTCGIANTYILSAGWGLIRADFLTPQYDITFAPGAESFKRRRKADPYRDFLMLANDPGEEILFFGGKDYVPLFCSLTRSLQCKRTVLYNSSIPPDAPGCSLERFKTTTRTNWHYECANAFLDNQLGALQR